MKKTVVPIGDALSTAVPALKYETAQVSAGWAVRVHATGPSRDTNYRRTVATFKSKREADGFIAQATAFFADQGVEVAHG